MPQLKIPRAETKTWYSPIDKYYKEENEEKEKGRQRERTGWRRGHRGKEGREKEVRGGEERGKGAGDPRFHPPRPVSPWKVTSL